MSGLTALLVCAALVNTILIRQLPSAAPLFRGHSRVADASIIAAIGIVILPVSTLPILLPIRYLTELAWLQPVVMVATTAACCSVLLWKLPAGLPGLRYDRYIALYLLVSNNSLIGIGLLSWRSEWQWAQLLPAAVVTAAAFGMLLIAMAAGLDRRRARPQHLPALVTDTLWAATVVLMIVMMLRPPQTTATPTVPALVLLSVVMALALFGIVVIARMALPLLLQSDKSSRELTDRINALLPQTQCGQCGHAGCRPYARAMAQGAPINRCPPGGQPVIEALARLLHTQVLPLDPEHGSFLPPRVAVIREAECIGCTKCIQACPVDAIVGAARLMHTVIGAECTGCDLCLEPCPVNCIDMMPVPDTRGYSL